MTAITQVNPAAALTVQVRRPRWGRLLARRWLVLLLLFGLAVRVVAIGTYFGGVDFHYDSYAYLNNAAQLQPDLWHPIVYPFFLRVLSLMAPASAIAIAQGLLGLGAGALVYTLARRFGLSDGWAAFSAAPVVLDAWQIAVEQTVMSEPVFEVLLSGGLLLLLGRRSPSWPRLVIGSTALSLACLTRTAALPVMALTLLFLLVRRVALRRIVAAAACCALPLLGYAAAFAHTYGPFELSGLNGRTLYGETATFARCGLLPATPTNGVLCPAVPLSQRAGNNQYTWDVSSPLNRLPLSAQGRVDRTFELNRRAALFAKQVIHAQPFDYARYVADTTGRYFTVGRQARLQDFPQVAWQFLGRRHPAAVYDITFAARGFDGTQQNPRQALPRSARLLRDYQKILYTPGPLLGVAGLLGLWVAVTRRRHLEAGYLSLAGLATLVMPSLAAGFDYRYLLPSLLLLPMAGALAASGLQQRRPLAGQRLRRVGWSAVSLLALSLAALNVVHAGIIPSASQTASRTTPVGQSAQLSQGLVVDVGTARPVQARCRGASQAHMRWWWHFEVPVRVDSTDAAHLVQGASVSFQGPRGVEQQPTTFKALDASRDVPTIVSRSSGTASGVAGFVLPYSKGLIRWSDSVGAGVAQWPLVVPAHGLPPAGSECFLAGETLTPQEP